MCVLPVLLVYLLGWGRGCSWSRRPDCFSLIWGSGLVVLTDLSCH
jgi:hypothetical protein